MSGNQIFDAERNVHRLHLFCGDMFVENTKSPYDNAIRGFSYALVEHESDIAAHDRFVSAL